MQLATGQRGPRGLWNRLLGVLLALLLVLSGATGQVRAQAVKGEIVSVGIGGIGGRGGLYRAGSWVPVQVRLENRSGSQFVGRLGVEQIDLDGDKVVSVGSEVILQPNDVDGRLFWTYFWPRPDDVDLTGIKSVLVLDKTGTQVVATVATPNGRADALGLGKYDSDTYRSSRWVVILGKKAMGWGGYTKAWSGTENVRFAWVQDPNQLPDNVLGLDGVDVIVWQADAVKPSEIAPEFQLKAMLDWVKAGGHLIVSVGTQGQEFLKGGSRLASAMPMTFTATREVKLSALSEFVWGTSLQDAVASVTQIEGVQRADARPIYGATGSRKEKGSFVDHPLAVTGVYGQGAVTILTFDAGHPGLEAAMNDEEWMRFWNQVAGWRSQPETPLTNARYEQILKNQAQELQGAKFGGVQAPIPPVHIPPRQIRLGDSIERSIDVTQEKWVRVLVAVLFLALYWLIAGPLGHWLLRTYKVVHWSWWVFGGTVLTATVVAGAVVSILHLTTYDVRHKTFVLGTVNQPGVSVTGFYGVFAPVSGAIEIKQPVITGGTPETAAEATKEAATGGAGEGMNYVVPLCAPTLDSVKPFADPQSYDIRDDHPSSVAPVFRNTLKKMQGRWNGQLPGIQGTAAAGNLVNPLSGSLTNNSGYDLENVQFIVYFPTVGKSYLYDAKSWPKGRTIDLAASLVLNPLTHNASTIVASDFVEDLLNWLGRSKSEAPMGAIGDTGRAFLESEGDRKSVVQGMPDDLLYVLMDGRQPDTLLEDYHSEVVRGFGRTLDCTKELHAAGALIVARAGSIDQQRFVKCPVPLTVNGRQVDGKGEVIFAWALPVAGVPDTAVPRSASAPSPISPRRTGSTGSLLPPQEK